MFQKKSEAKGVQEQLMTNPDMMQNMMKQQLTGLIPQVIQTMLRPVFLVSSANSAAQLRTSSATESFRSTQLDAMHLPQQMDVCRIRKKTSTKHAETCSQLSMFAAWHMHFAIDAIFIYQRMLHGTYLLLKLIL